MTLFEGNLAALERVDPGLAAQLRQTEADPDIVAVESPAGLVVPARRGGEGRRPRTYHSSVDPVREGARTRGLYPGGGYFIFLGLGGGYQAGDFLADTTAQVQRLVLIECDPGFVRAVLSLLDLSRLLADPRVRLLAGKTPAEIRAFLARDYLPLRDGALRTVPLRAAVEAEPGYFDAASLACREAVQSLAADAAVQARFGRRWFINTLANLKAARETACALPRIARAIVLAAGPSLESRLQRLPALRRGGWYVIAADTALPPLLASGIRPDLTVSLDCQHVSYHHFLQGLPRDTPLALDLASPPLLSRLAGRTYFFSGGHPFSRYLAARWRPFPLVDTSGGNVTQAAVSLAGLLGAGEILVFGADFSYPGGKAYARGTYLYPYYRGRETRRSPLESLFFAFLRRDGPLARAPGGYTTAVMDAYRRNLDNAVECWGGSRSENPAGDLLIRLPPAPSGPLPGSSPGRSSGWREFLTDYASSLQALPAPRDPLRAHLHRLSPGEHDLWMTLLPAAAAIARSDPGLEGQALLERTRVWTLDAIRRALGR